MLAVQTVRDAPEGTWRYHHREEVMGTVVTFDLFCQGDVARDQVHVRMARARAVLQRADAVFSTWNEDSPVSQLRRAEITAVQAPPEVAAVLEACEQARSLSEGWFDPWAMPGGPDPTGYVKGWAVQRALGMLVMPGVAGAIVNAAGDIASFGGPRAGWPFRVGIVDPADRRRLACAVELAGAVATSGTYERGEHLIDPRTAKPACRVASATVTGPDLGLADALATALAVAGPAGLRFLEPLQGYEGFVIGHDASWRSTAGFPFARDHAAGPFAIVKATKRMVAPGEVLGCGQPLVGLTEGLDSRGQYGQLGDVGVRGQAEEENADGGNVLGAQSHRPLFRSGGQGPSVEQGGVHEPWQHQ
jgi:thiamine biosynthesis lipoprotein